MSFSKFARLSFTLTGGWIFLLQIVSDRVAAQQIGATGIPTPTSEVIQLNPIVVSETIPHSETEIIAQQITEQAANLETVQSREQISRYPDITLGDSIRRLPGVGRTVQSGTGALCICPWHRSQSGRGHVQWCSVTGNGFDRSPCIAQSDPVGSGQPNSSDPV